MDAPITPTRLSAQAASLQPARKRCSSAADHLRSAVKTNASKTSSQPKSGRASLSVAGIRAAWTNFFRRGIEPDSGIRGKR